jgi:arsenite methyltransferase
VTEDRWAAWLRRRRSGGDDEVEARTVAQLAETRERILDNASFGSGETLLDVGCGNGLVAFGALARGAGQVVFADVSQPLLDESRAIAADLGVLDRCRFVNRSAGDLGEIEPESVDVVTTRSVLIYVEDKAGAFAEFSRVLRPGGRISLFEPINTFGMEERRREFLGLDEPGVETAGAKLDALFAELQPADDPMLDFDERDLIREAERAGFFAEAMEEALTAEETQRFVQYARPRVEQGLGRWRMGSAYVWATKPG